MRRAGPGLRRRACRGAPDTASREHAMAADLEQLPSSPPARTLRLAPEYRRSGVYLVVGYVLLAGTSIALYHAGLGRGRGDTLFSLGVLTLVLLGPALLAFRYRLRVDARGIWRRHVLAWDLWPWDAFA